MTTLDTGRFSARVRKLSPRELDIFRLVAEGRTNLEIGEELGIKEGTVNFQVGVLLQGLERRNRTELTGLAYRYPGFLESGRIALGPHPPGCKCEFSYCPERQSGPHIRIDASERLGTLATACVAS